jgi:hypothetical protein
MDLDVNPLVWVKIFPRNSPEPFRWIITIMASFFWWSIAVSSICKIGFFRSLKESYSIIWQNSATRCKWFGWVSAARWFEYNSGTRETFLYLQDSYPIEKKRDVVISTKTDTNDHRRSDEALQEQENYLKTIFNSVQIGLLVQLGWNRPTYAAR